MSRRWICTTPAESVPVGTLSIAALNATNRPSSETEGVLHSAAVSPPPLSTPTPTEMRSVVVRGREPLFTLPVQPAAARNAQKPNAPATRISVKPSLEFIGQPHGDILRIPPDIAGQVERPDLSLIGRPGDTQA